jgi:two-component system OmpR family sensor kinase
VFRGVRVRLTLWYTGVLATVLLVFSIGVYSALGTSMRQRLDDNLRSATQVTSLALNHETEEHGGREAGEANVRLVLNTMHQTSFPRPAIAVWDGSRLVAEKPGTAGLPGATLAHKTDIRASTSFSTLRNSAGSYRIATASVWVPSISAHYQVIANESAEPIEAGLASMREILMIFVPLCLLLAAAGGYFLARKSLKPVLLMTQTAEQISSHNLEQRLSTGTSRDELGLLAETFNRLFARLQEAFRQQRQFMADASHELRTPLSVALTATQVNLQVRNQNARELYEALEVVQSQLFRLRRVVEDMFMLVRTDNGMRDLTVTSFYLGEVILDSVRAAKVLGDARKVRVTSSIMREACFIGDEGLLRQLFLILLDNAVKYTPHGGNVDLVLRAAGDEYEIQVSDTGCGIAAPDQPFIFDRFFRADKSRSRRDPGAGSGAGLGLAIAKSIIELHKGELKLEHSGPSGSMFSVRLPCPAAEAETPSVSSPASGVMQH